MWASRVKVLDDSSAEHTRLGIAGMQTRKFDTFIVSPLLKIGRVISKR